MKSEFVIKYPNGSIRVDVMNYFAAKSLPLIKQLFKTAQEFCTEDERLTLIGKLQEADKAWEEHYQRWYSHRLIGDDNPIAYFKGDNKGLFRWQVQHSFAPSTEKQLKTLHTKFQKIQDYLSVMKWDG